MKDILVEEEHERTSLSFPVLICMLYERAGVPLQGKTNYKTILVSSSKI